MTSTTDKAGHPDVAEISDLTEGLLSPSRTEDVRQHLEGCTLCSDVYDSLEEIRGLLGTLPGPAPMPDDVAERIDAALAAEALLGATAPDETTDPGADRAAHVSRETSTADGPSGHPRGATGPGRSHRARRGRRRTVILTTALAAVALGLGAILVQSLGGDSSGNSARTATRNESAAQSTFSEKTLHGEVSALLAKTKESGHGSASAKPWGVQSQDAGTDSGDVKTLITPTPAVPQCVEQGTGDPGVLLAAKGGSFQGKRVYLLVVSDSSDRTKVTAYIVDAACEKQASPSPGKLLLTRSYARS
ncbi:anti-sigma factor family protein [Streptomyces sp. NPDC018036]|uniref:anti-sigma factor family protein n=1 Tax=Streptomyces sp. NPDC018036 TaxID=3365035 RepID=UPI0037917247